MLRIVLAFNKRSEFSVLELIEAHGITENTFVVYADDHGADGEVYCLTWPSSRIYGSLAGKLLMVEQAAN